MDKLDVFDEVMHRAHQGGGKEKVDMQHNLKKLTARERILSILDNGSFIEVGGLIKKNGSGVIAGHGTINGRLVYIYAEDYTVDGATFNRFAAEKICNIMDKAAQCGAPIIKVFDSIGGNISQGVELLSSYGKVLRKTSKLNGVIPQISVVAGPCNGIMAANATLSDFVVVIEGLSKLSINTNDSLRVAESNYIDNKLFDSEKSIKSGNANFVVKTEEEALNITRKILEFIPSNSLEMAPLSCEDNSLNDKKDNLNKAAIDETFNGELVINTIADEGSTLEVNKNLESAIKTYLIKLNGLTVGVIANGNEKSKLDRKLSTKVCRFVRICDSFNIPILSIVDTLGFEANLKEEINGVASDVGTMIYALSDSTVPKVSLVIGEAYGAGYLSLASKEAAFDVSLAWPTAKIALTNPKNQIKNKYIDEIINAENKEAKEAELIKEHINEYADPYLAAEVGLIDSIIKPSETKQMVFAMLDMLQSKRELSYPKKHGKNLL